jgi:hypothetical protein
LFPNPTKGSFYIVTGNTAVDNIRAFDQTGKLVSCYANSAGNLTEMRLSENESPGLFYINFKSGDRFFVKKIFLDP